MCLFINFVLDNIVLLHNQSLNIPFTLRLKYWLLNKWPWHYCNICKIPCRGLICNICLDELELISNKVCEKCRKSLPPNNKFTCHECQNNTYAWGDFYCNLIYANPLKKILHQFKYLKQKNHSLFLGYLLYHSIYKALDIKFDSNRKMMAHAHYDIIIPMPLHKQKRKERGFNQVEYLLLYYLYKAPFIIKAPRIDTTTVSRIKNTESQASMNKSERRQNLSNAFAIHKNVKNLKILLIDDVVTTGTTINEVTKLLLSKGADSVDICSLVRTV